MTLSNKTELFVYFKEHWSVITDVVQSQFVLSGLTSLDGAVLPVLYI